MRCTGGWWVLLFLAMLAWMPVGCLPSTDSRRDEQRDPNFLAGMSRYQEGSYDAAVEAFGKAIESNPRSASAHFQLGLVYYENLRRWPEAIYHFQRHLELDPRSNQADTARTWIVSSKQMIAREFPLAGLNVQMQQELAKVEGLTRENALLKQQVAELKARLAGQLTNPPALSAPTQGLSARSIESIATPSSPQITSSNAPGVTRSAATAESSVTPPSTTARTHKVKSGDTPYSIARRYGVSLQALLAANPGLNARQLRVDQSINLPSR